MGEAAEVAEDGVELDAEEGRCCSDWRCDEEECGESAASPWPAAGKGAIVRRRTPTPPGLETEHKRHSCVGPD